MNRPMVLIVDDQYTRDPAEKLLFMRRASLTEADQNGVSQQGECIAQGVFCSGQRWTNEHVENDYAVVRKAVTAYGREGEGWGLVLVDVRFDSGPIGEDGIPTGLPGDDIFGEVVRERLASEFYDLPIVMLSGKRQQELANKEIPYLSKEGLDRDALASALLNYGRLSVNQSRHLLDLDEETVASSPKTIAVFREAFQCARNDASVLILGESGVGKEVLAKYIHRMSARCSAPFVAINVAAIPNELLEAELFGVERRVATGVDARPGKFEQANGGTLFLDEVADIPLAAQVKLLRALQERVVEPVGGRTTTPIDVRIISATSRHIPDLITAGQFREDLYYRINTIPIVIPPLRERPEDILPLAEAFLSRYTSKAGKKGITLSDEAGAILTRHEFQGNNVRELENLIQRIVTATGNHRVISGADMTRLINGLNGSSPATVSAPAAASPDRAAQSISLDQLIELIGNVVIEKDDPNLPEAKPKLEAAFRKLLQRVAGAALERCRDPLTGELKRQTAVRLLTGDLSLKGKSPARIINDILGRKQEDSLTDQDLERLVELWRNSRSA